MQTYNLQIQDSSLKLMYTSLNTGSIYLPVLNGTNKTYRLTYYDAGNNPFYSSAASYKLDDLGVNYIPLKANINMYMIYTKLACSVQSNFATPTFSNSQHFYVKDCGGYSNNSNIVITGSNSDVFEGIISTYTINTAFESRHFLYSGSGSSGFIYII